VGLVVVGGVNPVRVIATLQVDREDVSLIVDLLVGRDLLGPGSVEG
jgi:hypothetical protein